MPGLHAEISRSDRPLPMVSCSYRDQMRLWNSRLASEFSSERSVAMPRLQVLIWFLLPLFGLLALLTFAGWISGAVGAVLFLALAALVLILAVIAVRQRATS